MEVILELKEGLLFSESVTLNATLPTGLGCFRATMPLCCVHGNKKRKHQARENMIYNTHLNEQYQC